MIAQIEEDGENERSQDLEIAVIFTTASASARVNFAAWRVGARTCKERMTEKERLLRVPSDNSLQYCGRSFGSWLLCRKMYQTQCLRLR